MTKTVVIDRNKVRKLLKDFNLRPLFFDELGWDPEEKDIVCNVDDRSYPLNAIAQKRGFGAYQYVADSDEAFPDHPTRQKIEKQLAKTKREHVIVYATHDRITQYWQWVKREPGQPDRVRQHIYHSNQSGEALIQKIEHLQFTLDEEDDVSIVDVDDRVRAAFDVEKVTKKFFDQFKQEHDYFLSFIDGITSLTDREWYASLMLNRMMFIYFIQKRKFLDGDSNYLRNRLERIQKDHGKDRFQTFYQLFLLRLFHEGLSKPASDRDPELADLLGQVPYLNGGLFEVHDLERNNVDIHIPDEAFQRIFEFFDAYQWHLDDRPLHDDNEINPDVLGYIFEKYINQKQMGAYYTKEDITGYISRNTIIPSLFDRTKKECPIAFKPNGGVWRLLQDDPDRYFHVSTRHGITYDIRDKQNLPEKRELPSDIAAGMDDVLQRSIWNRSACDVCALPTETWHEHIARRQRYEEIHAKLIAGEISSINDLITYNLDIERFAQDVITSSEDPELVRAFWEAITKVSILDPTCGSGAFLFEALNILEPIYVTCLEAMRGFLDDLKRSGRQHYPETIQYFQEVLERIKDHTSERYFILKTIIVGNLYGVDIMEEAVEICKLRLFLKLVAQLESYDQVEPLPDIDFNIRTGNTLVGFSSLDEVKRAMGDDMVKQLTLPNIEERAEIADRAFRLFREMQIDQGMDVDAFSDAKSDLRERLDELRDELDGYLAREYGIKIDDTVAYQQWRNSHQPFHWFVEFHGIMHGGGFDVIIGNPPYVSIKKISYRVFGPNEEQFSDIYANVLTKSLLLTICNGRCGMIVPLSVTFSRNFKVLRKKLCDWGTSWFSSYDIRPAALFAGVSQRCTIWVGSNSNPEVFMAPMYRWRTSYRKHLLSKLAYIPLGILDFSELELPKLASLSQMGILRAISSPKKKQHRTVIPKSRKGKANCKGKVYLGYSQSAGNFISVFREDPPCFDATSLSRMSVSEIGHLALASDADTYAALAATAGELYFWYWLVRGDGFHVTNTIMRDYLGVLDCLTSEHYALLIELGRILDAERNRWLVFTKYANRCVGNFSYRDAFRITRRADLLVLNALSVNREDSLAIFDYVQRVLAINEYAGEKGIPEAVKDKFPVDHTEMVVNKQLLSRIDSQIIQHLSFSEQDIAAFIEHDVHYTLHEAR